jgi:hypothetical protein
MDVAGWNAALTRPTSSTGVDRMIIGPIIA